jgi:hypothetical protein
MSEKFALPSAKEWREKSVSVIDLETDPKLKPVDEAISKGRPISRADTDTGTSP